MAHSTPSLDTINTQHGSLISCTLPDKSMNVGSTHALEQSRSRDILDFGMPLQVQLQALPMVCEAQHTSQYIISVAVVLHESRT